jgi:hypothetical protein
MQFAKHLEKGRRKEGTKAISLAVLNFIHNLFQFFYYILQSFPFVNNVLSFFDRFVRHCFVVGAKRSLRCTKRSLGPYFRRLGR